MWDLTKRIFHFISTVILYSLFFILIIIGIMVGLYFLDQFQASRSGTQRAPLFGAYMIVSTSMEPTIHVKDAVLTMRSSADGIKKDDVITFYSDEYGVIVTHRVVGIFTTDDGGYAYRTKGDNNNVEDNSLIPYDKVIGKVLMRLPYLGYAQLFLTSKYGWIVVVVLPCLWIIGGDIIKLIKSIDDVSDDEKKKKGESKNGKLKKNSDDEDIDFLEDDDKIKELNDSAKKINKKNAMAVEAKRVDLPENKKGVK